MECKSYSQFCSKIINAIGNTLATTVNEFVINELFANDVDQLGPGFYHGYWHRLERYSGTGLSDVLFSKYYGSLLPVDQHIWAWMWQKVQSDMCAQRRLKKVCTSTQSDQSLRCQHGNTLHPWLSKIRPVTILIRFSECAGWSESYLCAYVRRLVLWPHW